MKKIFLIVILLSLNLFGQWSTPAGYTPFLGLRYYSLDAQPGADSIRQNLMDIDSFALSINTTVLSLLSRMNVIVDSNNIIKDEVIAYNNLTASLKNKLVTKDLTETITGSKTFTNTVYATNTYPTTDLTYNFGSPSAYWRRGYFGWLNVNYIIINNPNNPADTSVGSYDGTNIVWSKPFHLTQGLNVTGNISADSLKFGSSVRYIGYNLTVNKADSASLVLPNYALFYLNPSANIDVLKYLEYINASATGVMIMLVNTSAVYTITLKDNTSVSGGNLRLAGDFVMGEDDIIILMRVYKGFNSYEWIELSRSNN